MNFWDSLWLLIWTFFFISYLFVLFNIICDLLRDSETSGIKKAIWVVFLLSLPALTGLTFLLGISPLLWAMIPVLRRGGDFVAIGGGCADLFSADLMG